MSILSICLSVHLFLYSITIHDCIDYLDGSKTLTKFYTRQQHCGQNCLIIAFIKWFIDLYKRFWSSIKQNIYYVRYLLLTKICWILKIHWRLVFSFRSINLKNLTIAIDSDFNKSNKVIYYTQSICPSIPHIYVLFNVNILPMIRGCGMTLTWGNWPNQSHNQMEFTIRSPSWTFFKLAFIWFLISSFFLQLVNGPQMISWGNIRKVVKVMASNLLLK